MKDILKNIALSLFVFSICSCAGRTPEAVTSPVSVTTSPVSETMSPASETDMDELNHDTLKTQSVDSIIEYSGSLWPDLIIKRLDSANTAEWTRPLQAYMVENEIESSDITVFYRYDKKVDGWDVTCLYMPYGENTETGDLIARLQKKGSDVFFRVEKSNNPHTYHMRSIGWKDGDVLEFNYIPPRESDFYTGSPLGYYSEIQFYDVDFDGEKELLINDFYRGQGGNDYSIYKISGDKVIEMNHDRWLFSHITNMESFDANRKEIVMPWCEGSGWYRLVLTFAKNMTPRGCDDVPIFHDNYGILEDLKEDYHHGDHYFELVEVVQCLQDTTWTSKRQGNSWSTASGAAPTPEIEEKISTNFIR